MAARRVLWRAANARAWPRLMSTYGERLAAEEVHAAKTKETWKKISFFICLPTISYFTWKHLIVGEGHHKYEFIPWSHLRIRTKPFPWGDGDASLFHNPETNPRPDGEPATVASSAPTLRQRVGAVWLDYLHEDPVKRDQERWTHLAQMQQRKEEHLARKRVKDVPIRPMDLFAEVKTHKPNPTHSGIDH